MSENLKLTCSFCNKTFSSVSNCRKHERNFHNHKHTPAAQLNIPSDPLSQDYECEMCHKKFSSIWNCRKHQKNKHGCIYKKHRCSNCEFSCSNANDLFKHSCVDQVGTSNIQPVESPPKYSCPHCEERFSKFVTLIKHKKMHVSKNRSHCSICNKSFNSIKACKKHERNSHAKFSRKFPCGECQTVFFIKSQLYKHIEDIHPHLMKAEENLSFNSLNEFKIWKSETEKKTLSFFVKRPYSASTTVYTCHRSGYYKSKSQGIRHLKLAGTCKINSYCPASITVKMCQESGVLNVSYYPTHLGHSCDVKHIGLDETEKEKIAGQLISGVPATYILNDIAEATSSSERLAVTTAQDIRNVARKYQINGNCVRNEDDVLSVEAWIHEMQALDKNPILLYKLPGETSAEYQDLEENDFILGFMNEAQEEILKIYGNEVICVDSTHGTNKYNIQLTSVLVKDDNWEGFPVAFLWSNRQHESVFAYFFQKVKERIGDLKTNSFMSDDYKAFYNAWCANFSKPNFYLLCDWHVKRALKKNMTSGYTKIKNEKVNEILNRMFELINEVDEATFKNLLNTFTVNLLNDPDTLQFGCYFVDNYCNRTEQWAACYRVDARINTNMTVERWHKDLKYNSDLKGKCGGRLDKAIHSLLKNLRLKLLSRLTSLQRGKLTKKISLIRKTHKIASNIKDDLQIFPESELTWIITSSSQVGETYKIKIKNIDLNHHCNLVCNVCNVCLHKITCTCPNYTIKYNMCKHIHAFCIKENLFSHLQQTVENPTNDLIADREKQAILAQKSQFNEQKDLNSYAVSLLMNLVPDVQQYSDEQCREFIKGISILKHKCEAIKSVSNSHKSLPPVASSSSGMKKIKPQRSFPVKKKNSIKKLQASYSPADTLSNILLSKPETYEVARTQMSIDHTYSGDLV